MANEELFQQVLQELRALRSSTESGRLEDNSRWQKARDEDRALLQEFKEDMKEDLREIKYDLRLDKEKLDKVYESRDQVTVKFSRAFTGINAVIAGFIALFISLWK